MTKPRLQFHLSTAIALMFAAAAVIWLNATPNLSTHREHDAVLEAKLKQAALHVRVRIAQIKLASELPEEERFLATFNADPNEIRLTNYGWPLILWSNCTADVILDGQRSTVDSFHWHSVSGAIVNALIAILILAAVCAATEWKIRKAK